MSRNHSLGVAVLLTLGLFVGGSYFLGQGVSAQEQSAMEGEYAETGAKACLKCHDEPPVNHILRRPHGQRGDSRTPFAAQDCESCHGPSVEHREAPKDMPPGQERPEVAVQFGPYSETPVAEQNEVCLDCHQSGLRINWDGSPHDFADVSCASCHDIHALEDPVQKKGGMRGLVGVEKSQQDVCFGCHAEIRAQTQRFSHHPIREGKVNCSDCHNPHGSFGPAQLKKGTVNEVCYTCHTEKRGPFLWEHPPVVEDCRNCHAPHGATQARMLKQRTPWLCQQCHLAAFHPSTAYDGTDVPPFGFDDHVVSKGCLNCHSQIHGSNHPSGVRFMR